MHLALVTHHYEPETNAPQRRWSAFVSRFVAAGHRVTVLAPPPHYPTGRAPALTADLRPGAVTRGRYGETVCRVRFREHDARLVARSLDQMVAAHSSVSTGLRLLRGADRPDLVLATAPGLPSVPAGMTLAALLRRPVVVEMRDAWPDLIAPSQMLGPDGGWRTRATRSAHRAVTALQRHASAVVTTTVSFADVLRMRGVGNVAVIRNGAHVMGLPALDPPSLVRHPAVLRVLYLGNLGRSQGLTTAVTAASLARRRGLDLTLRMVGSGAEAESLHLLAAHLDAPVEFCDRVPWDRVVDHYRWADTALVSLRSWAPFAWTVPSKLYEILAVNRHISAATRGESAQVLADAKAGDVVPPESPQALADLWVRLAAERVPLDVAGRGRAWVSDHADHDSLALHYLDLLEAVRS
ncbi:MAG: glycosyltransferase family 4 protein [Micrococcales bacterium]|nr:glycosyltransferase family 4 protein [Micrococcales bacterium]